MGCTRYTSSETFANCISACFPAACFDQARLQVLPGDVASLPEWLNSFAVAWLSTGSRAVKRTGAKRGKLWCFTRGTESGDMCCRRWGYPDVSRWLWVQWRNLYIDIMQDLDNYRNVVIFPGKILAFWFVAPILKTCLQSWKMILYTADVPRCMQPAKTRS